MKHLFSVLLLLSLMACAPSEPIDRQALVSRNSVHVTRVDTLASLTVGNGGFAVTVDVTGLQSLPGHYRLGVPLGTQSDWGWHSFANPHDYRLEETMQEYDFGRGHRESYPVLSKKGRAREAVNWYRANPHRLHLGTVGFEHATVETIADVDQQLDLYNGLIHSSFTLQGEPMEVVTACDPEVDRLLATIYQTTPQPLLLRFPYPTGASMDDGCDWTADEKHFTELVAVTEHAATLRRMVDAVTYYVQLDWEGTATIERLSRNAFRITPRDAQWAFALHYTPAEPTPLEEPITARVAAATRSWNRYWEQGAVVDFSRCTDPRAPELERRVVLSQYLLAAQCAGDMPPQETGLTYNSWYGKFHLEMIFWHQAQFALYGHPELLEHTLRWYHQAAPAARETAKRQGFKGLRWMKMTSPTAQESPSHIGPFLIWQQPHLIYLAELCYRANPSEELLRSYAELIEETAEFMFDFADYNPARDCYELRGLIPAQETLRPEETLNSPFELAYWRYGLSLAQQWRERLGLERHAAWDDLIAKLASLATKDGRYLAAESAPQTYEERRFTSDHMSVLGACGILPTSPLVDSETMRTTLAWVCDHWNWEKTWGWDYPTTAMCAVRLGEPERAIDALLMDKRTNTYLPNGHNYQNERLRCYLPGNGGMLLSVALMCAGWDGATEPNPGFPKNGAWEVRWEGLQPLP